MRQAWLLLLLAAACGEKEDDSVLPERAPQPKPASAEPERVRFDHILIAFKGAMQSSALRTRDEAKAHAHKLYHAIKFGGTAFLKTKERFTDDRSKTGEPRGPYVIVNRGLRYELGEIPRANYSKDLADKLFTMKVGEVAIVNYHRTHCPFGYHILYRMQ